MINYLKRGCENAVSFLYYQESGSDFALLLWKKCCLESEFFKFPYFLKFSRSAFYYFQSHCTNEARLPRGIRRHQRGGGNYKPIKAGISPLPRACFGRRRPCRRFGQALPHPCGLRFHLMYPFLIPSPFCPLWKLVINFMFRLS